MEFGQFMENSAKTQSFMGGLDRAKVKFDGSLGVIVFEKTEVWFKENEDEFKALFENGDDDKLVSVKILDIPYLHLINDEVNDNIFKEIRKD
jgi:hypothetical protein